MLEGSAETRRVSVPIEEEVDDRWCCEFREKGTNGVLHYGDKFERSIFLRKAVIGRIRQVILERNIRQYVRLLSLLMSVDIDMRDWAVTPLSLGRTPFAEMM